MKHRNGIRFVTTAMMTMALTMSAAGLAMAQDSTGSSWQQQADRATHALNLLESQGYTRFSDFQANGQNFTADVTRGGKTMVVMINPDTNQILPGGSATM